MTQFAAAFHQLFNILDRCKRLQGLCKHLLFSVCNHVHHFIINTPKYSLHWSIASTARNPNLLLNVWLCGWLVSCTNISFLAWLFAWLFLFASACLFDCFCFWLIDWSYLYTEPIDCLSTILLVQLQRAVTQCARVWLFD